MSKQAGDVIRAALKRRRMSVRQLVSSLAEETGKGRETVRSNVYRWLRVSGPHPSEEYAYALARVLNIPANDILREPYTAADIGSVRDEQARRRIRKLEEEVARLREQLA